MIVNDGTVNSTPATVTISTSNSPPVANAGMDETGQVGDFVQLDGSKSSDVDGDALTYTWALLSRPTGSQVVLTNPTAVNPSFTIDKVGTYVVQLIVNDGTFNSAPATVTITSENSAPVAVAGPDQSVKSGDTVTLDGSKSYDVDGDAITYLWSFTSKPAGSSAVLSDPTAVRPTFTVDQPGIYVAQLIVNDGQLSSDPSRVMIMTTDTKPVANAGPDQSVSVGATAILDGSRSSDAAGNPLTYQWSLITKPSGSSAAIANPTLVKPAFTVDQPGTYVAQLIVNDGTLSSDPATVTITTQNTRPVANAGSDQAVDVGATVTLDGSGSYDADHDTITYQWSISSKPAGSSAALSDTTVVNPTFTADLAGTYVIQLIVSDGQLSSVPATVVISTTSTKPVANAGASRTVATGATVSLNGGASYDPGGKTLSYAWSLSSKPASSGATLSGADTATPSFVADVVGAYVLSLTVSNGTLTSDPSSVTVTCAPPMVKVPDLTGMSSTDAKGAITSAGLAVGTITTQTSATVPANRVISQSPQAGTSVSPGSAVTLTVSLGSGGPTLVSIAAVPATFTLFAGQSYQCAAIGTYSDGSTRDVTAQAAWSTGNLAVAQVSTSGALTALSAGATTVTASVDAVSGSGSLTVSPPQEATIVISPAYPIILVGQSQTFTASVVMPDGTSQSLTSGVTWTSSDASVASITNGAASALAAGAVTITASANGMTGAGSLTVLSSTGGTTVPTALITNPATHAIVTTPVSLIGTAGGNNFEKYVIDVAPAGQSTFTTIAVGGSAVVDGVLGTFDPTPLPNGFYTVRLTVFDCAGNSATATSTCLVAAKGLAYLNASVNSDGSWGSASSLMDILPETTTATEALQLLGQAGSTAYTGGAAWLQAQSPQITDYLSRRMHAISGTPADLSLLATFRDAQTGGWGGTAGYGPNNLDTALALQGLLANPPADAPTTAGAASYLVSNQNVDGGWGFTTSDVSRVYTTALATLTLQQYGHTTATDAAVAKATAWLLARQNADGGFGDSGSTPYETALAISALSGSAGNNTALAAAANFLTSSQLADGSWGSDPYSTGLVLKALVGALSMY